MKELFGRCVVIELIYTMTRTDPLRHVASPFVVGFGAHVRCCHCRGRCGRQCSCDRAPSYESHALLLEDEKYLPLTAIIYVLSDKRVPFLSAQQSVSSHARGTVRSLEEYVSCKVFCTSKERESFVLNRSASVRVCAYKARPYYSLLDQE